MIFSYRVRDLSGGVSQGYLEADNRNLVIEALLRQNYTILDIKEERDKTATRERSVNVSLFQSVKVNDLSLFTRQLSTMVGAGLPIIRALQILTEQTKNIMLREATGKIRQSLEEGLALNEAMAQHPKIFSPMYLSMVKAGETGGVLDGVLNRLADQLERDREINSKIKAASIYPAVVLSVAVLVVIFILTYVMPTFVESFAASGVELPAFTKFFLGISDFLRHNALWLIIGIVLLVVLLKSWGRSPTGRLFFDRLYLKMPIVGKVVNRVAVSRFTRILGSLTASGVPIIQALEVLEGVVGNKVIGNGIADARESIREGQSIADPIRRTGVFEPMVPQMIAVGEETGALDDMLERMSNFYDSEVTFAVEGLLKAVEPVLIIFVAVVVGAIIVATYLPVFNIVNTLQ